MMCFMAISAHGPHSDFRSVAFPRHSVDDLTILDLPINDQTTNGLNQQDNEDSLQPTARSRDHKQADDDIAL